MKLSDIEKLEKETEIDLDWFYHSTPFDRDVYQDILLDGIKCNYLLNKSWSGKYNGLYYISLSKITIPNNKCFINNIETSDPSFIIYGIKPIECLKCDDYEKFINTRDERRMCNHVGEYQYYYWIKEKHIKGLVYNLYDSIYRSLECSKEIQRRYIVELLEIFELLKELNIDLPIYDYSRRYEDIAHEIDKSKVREYIKKYS